MYEYSLTAHSLADQLQCTHVTNCWSLSASGVNCLSLRFALFVNLACVGIVGPELAATSKDPFKCCHLPSDFDHVTVVSYGLQAVIVTS